MDQDIASSLAPPATNEFVVVDSQIAMQYFPLFSGRCMVTFNLLRQKVVILFGIANLQLQSDC